MRSYLDCIPCFIRQALEALRVAMKDTSRIDAALKKVLAAASKFDLRKSPPEMARVIHRIVRKESGCADPYERVKKISIKEALRVLEDGRKRIKNSADPFEMAVRYAIAGNILDFSLISKREGFILKDKLEKVLEHPLNRKQLEKLRKKVEKARTILVIGDNAGETVFDRLLVENLGNKTVYYGVKGSPVINDATREDALASGLDSVATVIDNGNDSPGTVLGICSRKFRNVFDGADLVIAKGQGNFETLNQAPREVFFLLQVKCSVIAEAYGYTVGDWLITTGCSGRRNFSR